MLCISPFAYMLRYSYSEYLPERIIEIDLSVAPEVVRETLGIGLKIGSGLFRARYKISLDYLGFY